MLAGWQLGPLLVSTAPEGESGLGYLFSQSCGGPAPQHPASQGPQARQTLHPPAQEAGVGWRHRKQGPKMDEKKVHSFVSLFMYVFDFSFIPTNCPRLCSRSRDTAASLMVQPHGANTGWGGETSTCPHQ